MLIPYDNKKLSEITHVKLDIAIAAMELFKKIGLVKILDNGEIYLTQLENMVGSETSKAALMRKKRMKDKILKSGSMDGNNVTNELPKSYTEIEKDIEQEKDIKEERNIEQEKEVDKEADKNQDKNVNDEQVISNTQKTYTEENIDQYRNGCNDSPGYSNSKDQHLNRITYANRANSSAYTPLTSILD